jgi:glycolate oxidase FAD binding subunit
VVTVRCGTPLAELEAALAEKGQCLAFEPPHFGEGVTVGGMVAAGLSGPARATAGAVRDYVLGARFINGLGEHLTFGGQVMKNVAGYDVSRLMAGSWGTLGLITEVSLKVLPVAPAEATLMIVGLSQKVALDLLHRWGGQPLPLNASAWVRDTTAQPVADYLFVRLRGAVAAVQSAIGKMSADAQALGAQVQPMANAEVAADWRASGEQTLPFFDAPSPDACLWRLSVPQTAPVLDLPGLAHPSPYIEWQGAQRWLWAPASAALALRELAQSVGGHATLFRASAAHAEVDKAAGVNTPLGAVQQRIQQQLQQQFDPKGVFATGRLHPL